MHKVIETVASAIHHVATTPFRLIGRAWRAYSRAMFFRRKEAQRSRDAALAHKRALELARVKAGSGLIELQNQAWKSVVASHQFSGPRRFAGMTTVAMLLLGVVVLPRLGRFSLESLNPLLADSQPAHTIDTVETQPSISDTIVERREQAQADLDRTILQARREACQRAIELSSTLTVLSESPLETFHEKLVLKQVLETFVPAARDCAAPQALNAASEWTRHYANVSGFQDLIRILQRKLAEPPSDSREVRQTRSQLARLTTR